MTAPTAPTFPRFCPACGNALPGPVPLCPRCGTNIAAATGGKSGLGGLAIAAIVVAVVVVGISCLGILAAIAIPNFVRYQLRAKASEVTFNMQALVKAEQALVQDPTAGGRYLALPRLPSGAPGGTKISLTPEELKAAAALGWMVEPALYGRYAVAVSEDGTAAAICGESDIDGDGALAVQVAFLPGEDGEAPPAPCTEPVPYGEQAPLVVEKLTGGNVF